MALEEVNDPNATLKFPIYNSAVEISGWKNVKAKDIWPQMDAWEERVTDKYRRERNAPKVTTREVWDRDLRAHIEDLRVPQEIDQWKKLEQQKKNARRWRPKRKIEPQKLESSLSRTFGNNSTFGVFQNGNFKSETERSKVEIDQTFAGGGFVFGKRVTLVEQTTKRNSQTRTTTRYCHYAALQNLPGFDVFQGRAAER
ncbi:hypothetical protein SAMN06296036_1439 [Pseudobacteriovorax antillogorgiicola]|uniref:Uncharacterized protein n=1 Tax=Pseudobacteriovorax antillogorgiicola TaxID=1513793 RepID=A0A1Y6CR67_9BACT|nr:hypothetical protein EDD56_14318 [Pseudobacteriovorax antillogorgiicola]SMF82768.1 hypothetical protein SAMN06296036_1439 [Pseudobacteriovorax antillogorgiicola]